MTERDIIAIIVFGPLITAHILICGWCVWQTYKECREIEKELDI